MLGLGQPKSTTHNVNNNYQLTIHISTECQVCCAEHKCEPNCLDPPLSSKSPILPNSLFFIIGWYSRKPFTVSSWHRVRRETKKNLFYKFKLDFNIFGSNYFFTFSPNTFWGQTIFSHFIWMIMYIFTFSPKIQFGWGVHFANYKTMHTVLLQKALNISISIFQFLNFSIFLSFYVNLVS